MVSWVDCVVFFYMLGFLCGSLGVDITLASSSEPVTLSYRYIIVFDWTNSWGWKDNDKFMM